MGTIDVPTKVPKSLISDTQAYLNQRQTNIHSALPLVNRLGLELCRVISSSFLSSIHNVMTGFKRLPSAASGASPGQSAQSIPGYCVALGRA
jgi:hypothetical protein